MRFSGNLVTETDIQEYDKTLGSSTFLITLNANKVVGADQACEDRLQLFCDQATSDPEFLVSFIDDISDKDDIHKIDMEMVEEVIVTARTEVGPSKQRFHAHLLMVIRHHTKKVFVDLAYFRTVCKKFISPGCYVNVRGSSIGLEKVLGYLHK